MSLLKKVAKSVFIISLSLFVFSSVFAHGWQTQPVSRVQHGLDLYKQDAYGAGDKLIWEPQSKAANLSVTPNAGQCWSGQSCNQAKDILDYAGGPLAFFKEHHKVGDLLCSSGDAGYKTTLYHSKAVDGSDFFTKVHYGETLDISWKLTAAHDPSSYFVFMTHYKKGEYNESPSLADLDYLGAHNEGGKVNSGQIETFPFKLPTEPANADQMSKDQVLVIIWQRYASSPENFVSCADVQLDKGSEILPAKWEAVSASADNWLDGSDLGVVKADDEVNFNLYNKNNVVKSYQVKVTSPTEWQASLADKINSNNPQTSSSSLMRIGVLNSATGEVHYDATKANKVYLNVSRVESLADYHHELTNKPAEEEPVTSTWTQIGSPLANYHGDYKVGTTLKFRLFGKNGEDVASGNEPTLLIDATNRDNWQYALANVINSHHYNVHIHVGVLQEGSDEVIAEQNNNNKVFVKSNQEPEHYNYEMDVLTPTDEEPTVVDNYPENIEQYVADTIVKYNDKYYQCLVAQYCQQGGVRYEPASGVMWQQAWKEVAKPAE
jgi:predicted carbohydrate-binding protein with CBM5 and CBM33 domain